MTWLVLALKSFQSTLNALALLPMVTPVQSPLRFLNPFKGFMCLAEVQVGQRCKGPSLRKALQKAGGLKLVKQTIYEYMYIISFILYYIISCIFYPYYIISIYILF